MALSLYAHAVDAKRVHECEFKANTYSTENFTRARVLVDDAVLTHIEGKSKNWDRIVFEEWVMGTLQDGLLLRRAIGETIEWILKVADDDSDSWLEIKGEDAVRNLLHTAGLATKDESLATQFRIPRVRYVVTRFYVSKSMWIDFVGDWTGMQHVVYGVASFDIKIDPETILGPKLTPAPSRINVMCALRPTDAFDALFKGSRANFIAFATGDIDDPVLFKKLDYYAGVTERIKQEMAMFE